MAGTWKECNNWGSFLSFNCRWKEVFEALVIMIISCYRIFFKDKCKFKVSVESVSRSFSANKILSTWHKSMVDELPWTKIISPPKKITTATKAQLKSPLTSSPSQHLAASWECLGYNMMSSDLLRRCFNSCRGRCHQSQHLRMLLHASYCYRSHLRTG